MTAAPALSAAFSAEREVTYEIATKTLSALGNEESLQDDQNTDVENIGVDHYDDEEYELIPDEDLIVKCRIRQLFNLKFSLTSQQQRVSLELFRVNHPSCDVAAFAVNLETVTSLNIIPNYIEGIGIIRLLTEAVSFLTFRDAVLRDARLRLGENGAKLHSDSADNSLVTIHIDLGPVAFHGRDSSALWVVTGSLNDEYNGVVVGIMAG